MQAAARWILLLMLAISLVGLGPTQRAAASVADAPTLQGAQLIRNAPKQCPPDGCAGGQRLGMSFEFNLTGVDLASDGNSNVNACFYAPSKMVNLDSAQVAVAPLGENTQVSYTDENVTECDSLPGYTLIAKRAAALAPNTPRDALRFAFRLSPDADSRGGVSARLYTRGSGGWGGQPTRYADSANFTAIKTLDVGRGTVYVANTAGDCGSRVPCFVNSDNDLSFKKESLYAGISTGLKDAVDVKSEYIYVIGSYTVGTTPVVVNVPVIIDAVGAAKITYSGPVSGCSGYELLQIQAGVTIRNLNITGGVCTDKRRDLIRINNQTEAGVEILYNDLTGGNDAISIDETNVSPVVVRFNDITGNTGYALLYKGKGDAALDLTGNNITKNLAPQVDCGSDATTAISSRAANHNYWGGAAPSADDTHCRITAAKRLGMRITDRTSANGLNGERVKVSTKAGSKFDGQISYSRTGSTDPADDFYLYIIDHGYLTPGGPPFSYVSGEASPSPCSNNWDVFLDDYAKVPDKLALAFKYNKNPACQMTINSSQYCDQTSSVSKYPLFWYDPAGATSGWDVVGARPGNLTTGSGQAVSCDPDTSEITLTLDKDGGHRPNLTDLDYTPLMVGVPVIKDFKPLAEYGKVQVTWSTNNEPDIEGFYVLHGTERDNLTRMTDLIASGGDATSGDYYYEYDYNRVNGTTYYYRLQVVRNDGYSFYSDIIGVKVQAATQTSPPPTRTPTKPYPTWTLRATTKSPQWPTLIPTRTRTPARTYTITPTFPLLATRTFTPELDTRTPGALETLNAMSTEAASGGFFPQETDISGASGTGTPLAVTPSPTSGSPVAALSTGTTAPATSQTAVSGAVESAPRQPNPWLSLFLGILAGTAAIGGAGGLWYYLTRR